VTVLSSLLAACEEDILHPNTENSWSGSGTMMRGSLVGWKPKVRTVVATVLGGGLLFGSGLLFGAGLRAQAPSPTPLGLVQAMVAHENDTAAHHERYEFLSNERSERTGGHLWTERVASIAAGRVRLLLAEDGKPLSAARQMQERARLAAIVADPGPFLKSEQAQKDDEANARQLLGLLPRGFIFDNVSLSNGVWRMDFHPNPDFSLSGIQERVLHGMSGWLSIDAQQLQLLHIEGSLGQDVTIGFGLLATIRAGSHFSTDRRDIDGHWRTVHVVTDIRGKAILFKTIARNSEISRSDFHYLDPGTTLAQAVALVEQAPQPAGVSAAE
jgi:hypothetical protein